MRILFCNYEYPPLGGGGGVVNAMLAEELGKRHEVSVLTSAGTGLKSEESVNGVQIVRVPVYVRKEQAAANFPSMAAYMINGVRRGRALLSAQQFDIINTHFVLPTGPVGNRLSRISGLPNVLSVHGGDLYDPSKFTSPHRHWMLRKWVRWLLRQADAVVGQSQNTLQNVASYYDNKLATKCIPLGINRPHFETASRSELGLSGDDFVLSTVGRLVSRKGLDRLLHILARSNIENLKLLVIGSGPLLPELQKLAIALGIEKSVVFSGFVEQERKFQLLEASDLYVSSSQHEGFGLVFLEAMAVSLPIICYNNGGQCDFLVNGKTGYLLELNDEDAFIESLRTLRGDQQSAAEVGAYNKRKVESYYIDSCATQYEELFDKHIAN